MRDPIRPLREHLESVHRQTILRTSERMAEFIQETYLGFEQPLIVNGEPVLDYPPADLANSIKTRIVGDKIEVFIDPDNQEAVVAAKIYDAYKLNGNPFWTLMRRLRDDPNTKKKFIGE